MPVKVQADLPVKEILEKDGYEVVLCEIVPDEKEKK